jgi:hypothetical protein
MINLENRSPSRRCRFVALSPPESLEQRCLLSGAFWQGFARDPQHTAVSTVESLPLSVIRWQTPVDLAPQYVGNALQIHYGSPLVTSAGTVIIPVKTGASGGFEVQARQVTDGTLNWSVSTDYVLPQHGWVPSLAPTLTPSGRLYIPAAGGTLLEIDNPDAASTPLATRLAFYGIANYQGSPEDSTIFIDTPITSDSAGDLFFGFLATAGNPLGLESGLARIDPTGEGTWVAAATAARDSAITEVVMNSAPALSADGSTVYVAVSTGSMGRGDLLALDSTTLATKAAAALKDPASGNDAYLSDDGTASPTIGPDGDVYFGVLDNPLGSNHLRGWLLHFSSDLGTLKAPGGFGWDDTPSIVPAFMVPSYQGTSTYLLMVKYNNYAEGGGDGINKIAILDPNETMLDPSTGVNWMCPVLTIAGPTPDLTEIATHPGAVLEWCINSAVVDPATDSILANSEDGVLYRWNLATNSFTEKIVLTPGLGEAYTPTVIANDGTVLAINNATLFAVGRLTVHHPPTAANDSYIAVMNTPLSVSAPGVLANDTDIDGNPITAVLVSQPGHGIVVLNPDGSFTYTPAQGYLGADSFTYKDTDGTLESNVATVSLTVILVYNPPVAADDVYSTNKGETLVVPAPGILGNDFAPDGGTLSSVLVRPTAHGSLGFTGGGGFTYSPVPSFSGVDTFQYKATDGISLSNLATVQIRVIDTTAPPILTPQPFGAQQGYLTQGAIVGTILAGNPSQAGSQYTATVNWGDGTPVSTANVIAVDSQLSDVKADHVYDMAGSFTFTITVERGFGGLGGTIVAQGTATISPLATPLTGSMVLSTVASRTPNGIPIVNQSVEGVAGTAPAGWQVQVIAAPWGVLGTTTAGSGGRFQFGLVLPNGVLSLNLAAVNPTAQMAGSQLVLRAPLGSLLVDTTAPVVQAVKLAIKSGQIRITFLDTGAGINPASVLNPASFSLHQSQGRFSKPVHLSGVLDLGPGSKPGTRTVALVIGGGRRLAPSRYLLRIFASSIWDLAGNLLDGAFVRGFPSGNHHPGTDFVALIDSRGRVLLLPAPKTK